MSTLDEPTGQPTFAAPQPPYVPPQSPYAQPQAPYAQPQAPYAQPQAPYAQPQPPYAQPQAQYVPQQPGPYQQAPGGMDLQPMPATPVAHGAPMGPVGTVRSTWGVIGLSIITLGIYSLYYYFVTYEEMKKHSGDGVGGVLGLVLAIFTGGLVNAFLFPHEVGNLYARQGRPRPVTATTGLWLLLGSFIVVGPLVWLIKSNGALNAYWRSVGAR